jgi:hypothetical protein
MKEIYLSKMFENLAKYFTHPLNGLLFVIAILGPAIVVGILFRSLGWGIAAGVIILIAFLRPFDIQPSVVFTFGTLIFVALNVKWQIDNFELRNRPYLQFLEPGFIIQMTGLFRMNDGKPEPALKLEWPAINHGPVPATIKDIRIKGHPERGKVASSEAISIGPYAQDRKEQWISYDIFPSAGKEIQNIRKHQTYFYFNTGDMKRLFGIDLSENEIIKGASSSQGDPGLFNSPYLSNHKNDVLSNFFLIFQIEYYALGETAKGKPPYHYWVIFHYQNGIWSSVESGTRQKIKG